MQVIGCIGDGIGALPKDAREKLKVFLYDDMCHLVREAAKKKKGSGH